MTFRAIPSDKLDLNGLSSGGDHLCGITVKTCGRLAVKGNGDFDILAFGKTGEFNLQTAVFAPACCTCYINRSGSINRKRFN